MGEISDAKIVQRGYCKEDEKWFSKDNILKLRKAQEEIYWLINRGYNTEATTNFVGGRYQFSSRQRDALKRSTSTYDECLNRSRKLLSVEYLKNGEIYIDGFNLIITLEVALSGSTLIRGNDGTVRDLAGLRGTYKLVDKTYKALKIIGDTFEKLEIPKAIFYLDSPVSNSGRLKYAIINEFEKRNCKVEVELVPDPDKILMYKERIVTTDSVILDKCKSWFNLSRYIIENYINCSKVISLIGNNNATIQLK